MLPPWLEALVLGVVQGLTEFIPISSSGHLVLVPYLLGFEEQSLSFDVMLHVGTLVAVLVYFRAELRAIAGGVSGRDRSPQGLAYRRVGLFIIPASAPVAVIGLLFADQVESVFESPVTAALLLLVTAALLLSAEAVRDRRVARAGGAAAAPAEGGGRSATATAQQAEDARAWTGSWRQGASVATHAPAAAAALELPTGIDSADPAGTGLSGMTLRQAMAVGLMQCLAVLPGISRSGSTIAGGVFAGLTREAATRFSFLLAIPALLGATLLSLPDLAEGGASALELGVGVVASFVSGYAAIRFLVSLVSRERLTGFAWYCIAASVVGLVGYAMLGPASTV